MMCTIKTFFKIIFLFQVQNDASQTSNSRSNGVPHGGRYTPLSALASLQPGGAGAQTGPHQGSSRFQSTSTYQHPFAPHQGDYIFNPFIFRVPLDFFFFLKKSNRLHFYL